MLKQDAFLYGITMFKRVYFILTLMFEKLKNLFAINYAISKKLDRVNDKLDITNRNLEKIMADINDLRAALSGITGDIATLVQSSKEVNDAIDAVLVKLQELKDQIANGGVITQADLDAVVSEAQAADTAGEDVKTSLDAAKAKLAAV